ncbi:hypothetical protein L1987_78228 [Smallanthus sonchifolius]|uniref:Uncharacterized protein n=1 Tax=Smallanthus sonchifolius TaxID=185202 RepID=A0ACB8ZCL1_9ASTR|nr:hypothetical protein L1987_78228 [Smallanthus sonchifolius]
MVVDTLMECVKDGNAGKFFILLHTISSSIPWVRKLVTLCNQIPVTPSNVVRLILENELCKIIDDMFERFDWDPIGSASIAQVHQVGSSSEAERYNTLGYKVVRCCLEHASSAAKTFLMSDCAVVEIREPEPDPVGDPMDT